MDFSQKYDPKTISKAEIIGSHFINRYCNALYESTYIILNKNPTLNKTEVYKNLIYEYIKCIEKNISFEKELEGIHQYFTSSTKYADMEVDACTDFILVEFVPESDFVKLGYDKKKEILCYLLVKTLRSFTEHIVKNNYLNAILIKRENT